MLVCRWQRHLLLHLTIIQSLWGLWRLFVPCHLFIFRVDKVSDGGYWPGLYFQGQCGTEGGGNVAESQLFWDKDQCYHLITTRCRKNNDSGKVLFRLLNNTYSGIGPVHQNTEIRITRLFASKCGRPEWRMSRIGCNSKATCHGGLRENEVHRGP